MTKKIKDLHDLADLINESENYPLEEVEEAIEQNGWTDTSSESDYDVCTDGRSRLVLDENDAKAKVI